MEYVLDENTQLPSKIPNMKFVSSDETRQVNTSISATSTQLVFQKPVLTLSPQSKILTCASPPCTNSETKPALLQSPSPLALYHSHVNLGHIESLPPLNEADLEFLKSFPAGYRFRPSDEELVLHYLRNKVFDKPLPRNKIICLDLYKFNPEVLAATYAKYGENEWYFFTPRNKKYRNGSRPNRAADDGYWKATGADRAITQKNDVVIGYKKALVFYKGKAPKGEKTNWIMHEYRVDHPPPPRKRKSGDIDNNNIDMRLDDTVLCRIYRKSERCNVRSRNNGAEETDVQLDEEDDIMGMEPEPEPDYNTDSPTFGDYYGYPISGGIHNYDQLPLPTFGIPRGGSGMMVAPLQMNHSLTGRYLKDSFNSEREWYHDSDSVHQHQHQQLDRNVSDMVSLEKIFPNYPPSTKSYNDTCHQLDNNTSNMPTLETILPLNPHNTSISHPQNYDCKPSKQ